MLYKVRIHPRVVAQIQGWHLPDKILMEVNLYLRDVLPADLDNNLIRESTAFAALSASPLVESAPPLRGALGQDAGSAAVSPRSASR